MATIRKRGDKWHVQIRRRRGRPCTRTFSRKADALVWANHIEAEADRIGLPANLKTLDQLTVSAIMVRYRDTIVPLKRGRAVETTIINAFLRHPVASRTLSAANTAEFASYRDQRLAIVAPATRGVCSQVQPSERMNAAS